MKTCVSRGWIAWHELVTTDPAAAVSFYTRTIGWTVPDPGDAEGSSACLKAGERTVGGVVSLAEVPETGMPHWLMYLGCPDIEATCRQAESLGGRVVVPPQGGCPAGCRAVLADPQGAIFGIVAAATAGSSRTTMPGEFSWHELSTTDCQSGLAFYRALFGWEQIGQFDLGASGIYHLCGYRGISFGGVCAVTDASSGPAWLPHIHVADVRIAADRTCSLGGVIAVPAHEVPGGEWVVVGRDPQGGRFAAHEVKPR